GRFGLDDVKVLFFGQSQIATVGHLRHLPFADDVGGAADHPAGGRVAKTARQVKRVREQIVPEKNAGFVGPAGIDGGHVTARRRFVEHVVVDKRGRVNHLDDGGENEVRLFDSSAGQGRKKQ